MSEPTVPRLQVSDQEIGNMRHNLNLIRSQVQTGRVDGAFLGKQVDKLIDLMGRMEQEHRLLKKQGRLEALYEVSSLLGSSLDLQTVLDQVMDAILNLTSSERGFLMLRNDDGVMEVKAARNFDQQTLSSDQFKYSRTIVNRVMDGGESIATTNAAEDPRFAGQASIIGQSLRSIMATPLRARGSVFGVVYVDNRAIAGLFDNDDLATLATFAGQAAIAIDNAQLFSATDQKLQARVDDLRQLRYIDSQLTETLDTHKTMFNTLDWACRLSGATIGHLGLTEGKRITAVNHYGVGAHDTQPVFLEQAYPQSAQVAQSGQPIREFDTARKQGILIAPLKRENKVVAILVLRKAGNAFTQEQQEIVERVTARAAVAIENARLYAAVQEADRAKSEFVGIVAHDLKVPMTSILGYADLTLMDGNLADDQSRYLYRIRDTVDRMRILVSDLADISRIESGHFSMEETRVKPDVIARDLRDSIWTQLLARNHTYHEELAPDLPDLLTDYYRLLQVLTNLTSNAIKYTPPGGTITLGVRAVHSRVHFSITDTGVGLSSEAIRKLGTKFWRAEDEFTRSQPGTGLGYAITRSLVEQMGSQIHIESQPQKGSKFTFSVATAEGKH